MSRQAAVISRERASSPWLARAGSYTTTAVVGVAVAWLAYDGGSFALTTRNTVAIGVWWTIIVAVALALWPVAEVTRSAVWSGGLLLAFAGWTLASALWAASAEDAFSEFDRALLYVGVFCVTVFAFRRGSAARVADGLALAIVVTGLVALGSRCYPNLVHGDDALHFLPAAQHRLSYPLDYWNGLAIFLGLGFPLLFRVAAGAESPLKGALALAPVPALTGAIYMTSSRGGVAAAFVGTLLLCLLTTERVAVLAPVVLAGMGSAAVIAALHARPELVNDPRAAAAVGQGRSAGVLIVLACLATGAAHFVLVRFGGRALARGPRFQRAAAVAVLVVVAAGVVAVHPVRRFNTFKQAPPDLVNVPTSTAQAHLLSGGGTGRWQQWAAALDEWKTRPLTGRGAGSYEAWWAQHGSMRGFINNAHSLYAEALGELGLVGLALLVLSLGAGVATGLGRLRRASGQDRTTLAALIAAFLAYLLGAGIDWMWQMTVVSVAGIVLLGLLTGPAMLPPEGGRSLRAGRRRGARLVPATAVVLGLFALYAEATPVFADLRLRASRSAVEAGDYGKAVSSAADARKIEPWAATPYLQLALVAEQSGQLAAAHDQIEHAIARDGTDWRLWVVRARIETDESSFAAASRSIRRAARLNPRSSLFAALRGRL